jgi:hypothetical protein
VRGPDRIVSTLKGEAAEPTGPARTPTATYLAAKSRWLQRQFRTPLELDDLPFIVGRGPVAGDGLPPLQLDDTVPFRLSRNHFMIDATEAITCATSAARLERLSTASPSAIISAVAMRDCERER